MKSRILPVAVIISILFVLTLLFLRKSPEMEKQLGLENSGEKIADNLKNETPTKNENKESELNIINNQKKPMDSNVPIMEIDSAKKYQATIKTSVGDIVVELNPQTSPQTVNSFVHLAKTNFYNNTIFHRTINGFMIQGGDPKGDGTGGPNYRITETPGADTKYLRGTIAMAKRGDEPAGTSGSQFFIMHKDYPLPPDYITFGQVTTGLDVVDKIATAPVKSGLMGENSTPVSPVSVTNITVVEK